MSRFSWMIVMLAGLVSTAGLRMTRAGDADQEAPLPPAIAVVRSFAVCRTLTPQSVGAVLSASMVLSSRDEDLRTYSASVPGVGDATLTCDPVNGDRLELIPVAPIVIDYMRLYESFGRMGHSVRHDPRGGGPVGTSYHCRAGSVVVEFSTVLRKESDDNIDIRKITIRAVASK